MIKPQAPNPNHPETQMIEFASVLVSIHFIMGWPDSA
jgi:hypothetical protein